MCSTKIASISDKNLCVINLIIISETDLGPW